MLVQASAEINAQRSSNGMTPLHQAARCHNCRRGWLDFHKAQRLVRWGANLGMRTWQGQLPGHLVNVDNRFSTAALLDLLPCSEKPLGKVGNCPTCGQCGCRWCEEA